MPHPSKRSAQAQSQRLAGSKSFGTVQTTGSDTGSIYSSESEDEDSSDSENDITALQTLYTTILTESLKFDQVKSNKVEQACEIQWRLHNHCLAVTEKMEEGFWRLWENKFLFSGEYCLALTGREIKLIHGWQIQLMWTGEVYDEEEDLTEDPVGYLASEAGIDLLDFCVDYLETSDDEGAEDNWVDEDELQVSLPFSDCLVSEWNLLVLWEQFAEWEAKSLTADDVTDSEAAPDA